MALNRTDLWPWSRARYWVQNSETYCQVRLNSRREHPPAQPSENWNSPSRLTQLHLVWWGHDSIILVCRYQRGNFKSWDVGSPNVALWWQRAQTTLIRKHPNLWWRVLGLLGVDKCLVLKMAIILQWRRVWFRCALTLPASVFDDAYDLPSKSDAHGDWDVLR